MKQPIRIPKMRDRNIEDLEKERASQRASILYEKRYSKYFMVEHYLEAAIDDAQETQKIVDSIHVIANDISSGDSMLQMAAVAKMQFIAHFSMRLDKPGVMHPLVERGIIPHLLRFLENCHGLTQIKGADVLVALLDGFPDRAQEVINHGGAATIVGLLTSSHWEVQNLGLDAMTLVSDRSRQYRDALLESNAITQLAVFLEPLVEPAMLTVHHRNDTLKLKKALQALSSLCAQHPVPAFHLVEVFIPIVQRILNNVIHPLGPPFSDICSDACLILHYIIRELAVDRIQDIVDVQFSQRLITLMQAQCQRLVKTVHLILQRLFSCGIDALGQVLIDNGIIQILHHIIMEEPLLNEVACKTMYAMIHRKRHRVQTFIDGNFIQPLLQIVQEEFEDNEGKRVAINVLAEVLRVGSDEQIELLVNEGCIQPLCQYGLNEINTRVVCIEGFKNIIRAGNRHKVDGINIYAESLFQFGGNKLRVLKSDAQVGDTVRWILMQIEK